MSTVMNNATVFASDGRRGTLCSDEPAPEGRVVVRFGSRRFVIPPRLLTANPNGSYSLPLRIPDSPEPRSASTAAHGSEKREALTVPGVSVPG